MGQAAPVDVFPACIDDAAVVQDRGGEVHQVIGGEPLLVLPVAVHAVNHRRSDHVAIRVGRFAVGDKRDSTVGQPSRIEVIVRAVR